MVSTRRRLMSRGPPGVPQELEAAMLEITVEPEVSQQPTATSLEPKGLFLR